jgi:hypothetical protein
MNKNKLFFFLMIIISFLFFSGFMFQSSSLRLRRIGLFPIIKYQVNVDSASLGFGSTEWVRIIEEAANSWFQFGGAKIYFKKENAATTSSPMTPATINCSDSSKDFLQTAKDTIYVATVQDPDCTGTACTFIWSCGDEIQHADIQFNPEFSSELAGNPLRLMPVLLHEFGHASGLDHCATGDTIEGCRAKQRTDFASFDPNVNSTMHKFYESTFSTPQLDDQAGIQKLYGQFSNSFPKIGAYALNAEEIEIYSTMENQELSIAHLIASPEKQVESFAELMTFLYPTPEQIDQEINAWAVRNGINPPPAGQAIDLNYMPPKLTREQGIERDRSEMNNFFGNILSFIPQLSSYQLSVIRINSVTGIRAYYTLKDYLLSNPKLDAGLVQENLNWHIRIRQAAIDEQLKR